MQSIDSPRSGSLPEDLRRSDGPTPARRRRAPRGPASPTRACQILGACLRNDPDPEAWRGLLRRYERRIHCLVATMARKAGLYPDAAEVEDMVQDLFVGWLRRGQGFDGTSQAEFWLFVRSSARNLAVDRRRHLEAVKRSGPGGGYGEADGTASDEGHEAEEHVAPPERACPETRLLARERRRLRLRRLRRLAHGVAPGDPRAPKALSWVVMEGRSSQEACRLLARQGYEVTREQIDRWVHRLRRRLSQEGLRLPRRGREGPGTWAPRGLSAETGGVS